MSRAARPSNSFVSRISLVGRSSGLVRSLAGFRKQHHTVPDVVNPTTSAFLAKLCATNLAEEAENFFQRSKAAFGYKRAELALEVASPAAVLTTRDFILELVYSLERSNPAAYEIVRTLHGVKNAELVARQEFNELFSGRFDGLLFGLANGVRVEAVIDAVEGQSAAASLTVAYPSDCRQCTLRVEGVAAEVICDGVTLEMRFPRAGAPAELVEAFAAVRSAFALTKNRALGGLL